MQYTIKILYRNVEIGRLVYEITLPRAQGRVVLLKVDERYAAIRLKIREVLNTNPTAEMILGGWTPRSLHHWYDGVVKALWVVSGMFQGMTFEAPEVAIEEPEGELL